MSVMKLSRGIVISLLFLVVSASGYSYIDELLDAMLVRNRTGVSIFSDSSLFSSQTEHYNLVTMSQEKRSSDKSFALSLRSLQSRNRVTISKENWGFGGELLYHRMNISLDHSNGENDDGELRGKSPQVTGTASAWFRSRGVTLGISLGNSFSSQITSDTSDNGAVTSPITSVPRSLPITIRSVINYDGSRFHGGFSFYRGLLFGMVPSYSMLNSGSYRTAPLSMIEQISTISSGIHSETKDSLTISFGVHRQWGTSFFVVDNALPVIPEFLTYKTTLHGRLHNFTAEALYWQGSSYLFAYDSEELQNRFIIFDNLSHQRLYANGGYSGKRLSGSVFAEQLSGTMNEYGYVDFYPLSSWTIFKSYAYRFNNGRFKYQNIGGEISGKKSWSDRSFSQLTVRTSYAKLSLTADREERKVAVLLPIYTNDTTISYLDQELILGDIAFEQCVKIRDALVTAGIKQLIPIPLNNTSRSGSSGSGSSSTSGASSGNREKVFGGMRLSLNVSIPLQ